MDVVPDWVIFTDTKRPTKSERQVRDAPVLAKNRMRVEIYMPQDIYIYDPNVPVPKNVRHVEIPEEVTVIKESTFRNCYNPQSVTIPGSVTKIGDSAFYGCSALQSVTIPGSVTKIGNSAFYGCSALQSVTIPDSITKIEGYAFYECSALQSVTIPDSVTEIGYSAFNGCSGLRSVTIPDGVTEISGNAFCGCSALQSVRIPDSVTEIGYSAFNGCSGLRSVMIPDGVTKISGNTFCKCSALQSVRIPDSVTEIGYNAFNGCSDLQSVTIPDGVTEISGNAFYECSALQSVRIPDSVTEIWSSAFYGCSDLQSVTIPDGITKIAGYTFCKCSALQSVRIPNSVTEIGYSAFQNCSDLRSVTIPDGVTEISDNAFYECSALRSVTIPDSVTEIGAYAFASCSGLQSVTIPDSVTEIRTGVFQKCSGLQSVTIPDGVTKIDDYAFQDCSGLQLIMIPDSITEIESETFCNCPRLQSIVIPNGVTKIGNKAFADCPALQSLIYKGINISPFINIDGYGVDTFDIIKALNEYRIPLNENTVKTGIDMAHRNRLSRWIDYYQVFGEVRLPSAIKFTDQETKECLRQLFAAQKKTGCHIPKILDKLAITVCVCGISPERLTETFDIRYTEALIRDGIPTVPATACRCYYDRGTCDMLIRKDKISVMAEAIGLYNRSEHRECYRHLMDFILSHPNTKIEDLQHAVDYAEEIPMRAGTTLTQIRQHRTYMENFAEVTKIEAEYGETVSGFKLSDYPCNIEPVSITYNGMTARVLDLSDEKDIALAARLGELTCCCQRLGRAGETAMMHGFLNPDAGFWVIEDKDANIKAQAEIWKTNNGNLVFDNIEFANTDKEHLTDRADRLRGVIAAWAMESGYQNIIMGCGYNELGVDSMEQAPIPELCLTPEEVFALQKDNDASMSFGNVDEVHRYMQTEGYDPNDFVYTDAGKRCVYIKKRGAVSEYLMQGYDRTLAEKYPAPRHGVTKEQGDEIVCK